MNMIINLQTMLVHCIIVTGMCDCDCDGLGYGRDGNINSTISVSKMNSIECH